MKPKTITFYLPQFHTIPENDEWWGDGFTDWISTKNAKPLFPGHYQPKLPAHDYYYNLLDKKAMSWQAQLAKKAGIYGFCIYHYWFGDDKQLLEKPAENLLKWQDIDINYCFSWANESWVCSWSNLMGNAWVNTGEGKRNKNHRGMLVEQKYGDKKEWKKHFEYLLPFFKDERYIKKDKRPVFIIYNPKQIQCIKEMIEYWNALAVGQGIPGIYFIGTNCPDWKKNKMNAGLLYEPAFTLRENERYIASRARKRREFWRKVNILIPYIYSYDKVWNRILSRQIRKGMYLGGFVNYDDSPRRGRNGSVVQRMSPRKFGKYFSQLYEKAWKRGDDYLFLTAWNEWGEGAYLEPDSKYGIRCLQEIRNITKISE